MKRYLAFGWKVGLEPTTFGTTIRRSNQLSYTHHVDLTGAKLRHFLELCKWLPRFFAYVITNLCDFSARIGKVSRLRSRVTGSGDIFMS